MTAHQSTPDFFTPGSRLTPSRVILVDRDPGTRTLVRAAVDLLDKIGKIDKIDVIEEFDSIDAALQAMLAAPSQSSDSVLLVGHDSSTDAFELIATLQSAKLDVPVLVLLDRQGLDRQGLDRQGLDRQGADERVRESLRRSGYAYVSKANLDAELLVAQLALVRGLHAANRRAAAAESELRHSVDQLRRAIAARDSVLAVVSHDLRGPLNNIELAMGLLEENIPAEQRALAIATVHRAVTRADRLIHDLLDVARLSGGSLDLTLEPIDPVQIIDAAVADTRPLLEQHAATLRVDIADPLGSILADRGRVVQVLDNLLRNAIKYGPRGGEIIIQARRRSDAVEFAVRDFGPGLDADAQEHVFDRFWRAKDRKLANGSGLGLAIAQGLVHSHGGEIGVESRPGRGARFYFSIPLAQEGR